MTIHAQRGGERRGMRRPPAASWLTFSAAPAFAVMSVLSVMPEAAPTTCLGGPEGSFLGGMAWMYLMMSVVHLPPWLRLFARLEAADRPQ